MGGVLSDAKGNINVTADGDALLDFAPGPAFIDGMKWIRAGPRPLIGDRVMEWNNECFDGITQEDATHAEMEYYDCAFLNCRFTNVVFRQCRFHRCRFSRTMFRNVELANGFMSSCVFEDCGLSGMNWGEQAVGGKSPFAKMVRCTAKYLVFPQFKMGKTDFSHSTLHECGFMECGLVEADFRHCVFVDSTFQQCDLRKADFREARGYAINVLSNKVGQARFMMPDAIGLLAGLGVEIT